MQDSILEKTTHISRLTPDQKEICIKALVHLAHLDGSFDESEKNFIIKTAQKMQIEVNEKTFDFIHEDVIMDGLQKLNNRHAALELIKELCLLGHADENLSNDEILFIGHTGKAMGIELDKIDQIIDWIIAHIIWQEQGKIIFEDYCNNGEKEC